MLVYIALVHHSLGYAAAAAAAVTTTTTATTAAAATTTTCTQACTRSVQYTTYLHIRGCLVC